MVLTDEEKRVFDINDKEEFNQDSSYIERLLYYIHDINPDEEKMHIIKTTLNFIKRMIIEYSQKKGYNITGNESYNIDDLLNEIIVP